MTARAPPVAVFNAARVGTRAMVCAARWPFGLAAGVVSHGRPVTGCALASSTAPRRLPTNLGRAITAGDDPRGRNHQCAERTAAGDRWYATVLVAAADTGSAVAMGYRGYPRTSASTPVVMARAQVAVDGHAVLLVACVRPGQSN
jgi:hypothetical protein